MGNSHSYAFSYMVRNAMYSITLCGAYRIGKIPANRIGWLHEQLKDVPVVRGEPKWDSQTWVVNAVNVLLHQRILPGIIDRPFAMGDIREDLLRQKAGWQKRQGHYLTKLWFKGE